MSGSGSWVQGTTLTAFPYPALIPGTHWFLANMIPIIRIEKRVIGGSSIHGFKSWIRFQRKQFDGRDQKETRKKRRDADKHGKAITITITNSIRSKNHTMKLIASFALLFAGVAAAEGVKVGKSIKDLIPDMTELRRSYVHTNRMLEVSAQCEADTEALYNIPELADAISAWETEFSENAACNPDAGSTTVECAFDSTTLQSHQALEEACANVGGKVYLVGIELSCQVSVEGESASFAIDTANLPSCLAMSCDEANVNELVGGIGDELDQAYEEGLGLFVDSIQCDASIVGGSGSTNGAGGTAGTGTTSTSSAYSFTGAVSAIMMALMSLAV